MDLSRWSSPIKSQSGQGQSLSLHAHDSWAVRPALFSGHDSRASSFAYIH